MHRKIISSILAGGLGMGALTSCLRPSQPPKIRIKDDVIQTILKGGSKLSEDDVTLLWKNCEGVLPEGDKNAKNVFDGLKNFPPNTVSHSFMSCDGKFAGVLTNSGAVMIYALKNSCVELVGSHLPKDQPFSEQEAFRETKREAWDELGRPSDGYCR